jgi:predicted transcriptional regulator
MYYMAKGTLTIRIEPETKNELDRIAAAMDRDRSYVVNEALAAYVDTHRWQIEHIEKGLREAEAGKFAPDAEVKRALRKLRRR